MNFDLGNDPVFAQQLLSVLIFIVCVFTVAAAFTILILRMLLARVFKKSPLQLTRMDKGVFVLGVIGILCVLYGFFIEPYWLSIETIKISSDKIRQTDRPIRIVQISDLHCDPTPRLEEKLPNAIAAQKPDVIAFTGDSLNSPGGLPICRQCLTRLAKIAPTFAVRGNWDAWYFKNLDIFGGTGVTELNGKPSMIEIAGNHLWIGGLPAVTEKPVAAAMANVPENDYRIFLFHYPDFIEEMAKNKIDLYLAGHTHGGQVALPFYGALVTMSAKGKQYESGLYKMGQTNLYVNRGIGMEGGTAPRVRFCARPEITVIDLYGTGTK